MNTSLDANGCGDSKHMWSKFWTIIVNEVDETTADMFLNWIYSNKSKPGFKNRNWDLSDPLPSDHCGDVTNVDGCQNDTNPGTSCNEWMIDVMGDIIQGLEQP